MDVLSFFSGAGGLDTGFHNAGFNIIWANEFDKKVVPTLQANFPHTVIDSRSLFNVPFSEIPDNAVGIVGGPPCQSWSLGGLGKGLEDKRGEVFLTYLALIEAKQPLFFLAENVKGMLARTRKKDLDSVLDKMNSIGYDITYKLVNAKDYGVPQDRWRVIFVGVRKDLGKKFVFNEQETEIRSLKDSILDLKDSAIPALAYDNANSELHIPNHEYSTGTFSSQFMSRNRIRNWDDVSFTVQASSRQAPLHPDSGGMVKIGKDLYEFANPKNVRRLTVREAARIQTFPDSYKFLYNKLDTGYKMVGNAVPVLLAEKLATEIKNQLNISI